MGSIAQAFVRVIFQVAAAQLTAEVSSMKRKHSLYASQAEQQHPLQRNLLDLFFNNPQQVSASIKDFGVQAPKHAAF